MNTVWFMFSSFPGLLPLHSSLFYKSNQRSPYHARVLSPRRQVGSHNLSSNLRHPSESSFPLPGFFPFPSSCLLLFSILSFSWLACSFSSLLSFVCQLFISRFLFAHLQKLVATFGCFLSILWLLFFSKFFKFPL